ncbi:MAG TPA: hypothetical protein VG983_05035 [Caulobacterales bacterium]|nr:hypothetical protein [Caulobacterales bacterium]
MTPTPVTDPAFAQVLAGDVAGAIRTYRDRLRAAPRDSDLHHSLGHLLLMTGDFAAGLEECEWRRQPKGPPVPRWRGAPLNGARILVHGEQGFGDNFQFVRYASLVADRGGKVVLGTRAGMKPLLMTVPGVVEVVSSGEPLADIACHVPMMSLPYVFGTRLETIPNAVPYMTADPARVAAWKQRLAAYPGLKVGLVWSGNTAAVYNKRRSPGFQALRPLIDCPGVTAFGLQMGGGREDLDGAALPGAFVDLGPDLTDFAETAAAMTALDLIVSPCTSTAHLAGALGRPLWVMLATAADWRWFLDRDDSPWYPTARLFRQAAEGDWTAPVARMRADLERAAAKIA